MNFPYAKVLEICQTMEHTMEYQRPSHKEKTSILTSINFFLLLVILICANYLYIGFLFK